MMRRCSVRIASLLSGRFRQLNHGKQSDSGLKRIAAVALAALVSAAAFAGCGSSDSKGTASIQIGDEEYSLKEGIRTYLLLGVDTEGSLQEKKEPGLGGQSDAIYLLVCDKKQNRMRIIGVPRDLMTEIRVYLPSGEFNGTSTDHLTLQYAFGDGREKSCLLTQEVVSSLFYGIPIDGYVAMNLGAAPEMADALGGVEVVVPDDSAVMEESSFVKGAEVTLDKSNVKKFLRFRDTDVSLSAFTRMERHKAFFKGCARKVKKKIMEDPSSLPELYQKLSPLILTNISLEDCRELAGIELDENIEIVPGSFREGDFFEEFYADESALRDLVIRVFCK